MRLITGTTGNDAIEAGDIYVYTENKTIVIAGINPGDEYMIYDASGRLIVNTKAGSNRERVSAVTGYYVIQINGEIFKTMVK